MSKAIHTAARFNDEDAAREHLESIRWPRGPECPHCGGTERNSRLSGASHRPGLLFCGDCRKQFSVTVGTVFERSKIPLHKWVLATHLVCSSKISEITSSTYSPIRSMALSSDANDA